MKKPNVLDGSSENIRNYASEKKFKGTSLIEDSYESQGEIFFYKMVMALPRCAEQS